MVRILGLILAALSLIALIITVIVSAYNQTGAVNLLIVILVEVALLYGGAKLFMRR